LDDIWLAFNAVDENIRYHVHAVHYDGSQWSSEIRLDTDATDSDREPDIALNSYGEPWVVWRGGLVGNPLLDIFYNRYEGPRSQFIRGDASGDGRVTLHDAIYALRYLFVPAAPTPACMRTADSDDDGSVAMSDATYTLRYLYVPCSPEPPPPFPECGTDCTPDILRCEWHPCEE
jgi:hypothetical protein